MMEKLVSAIDRLIEEAFTNASEANDAKEVAFYRGQAQAYIKVLEEIERNEMFKLRGRIIEKYRTISRFAEAMGVTQAYVSYMINGKKKWSDKWKARAMWLLDIPEADEAVFFPEEVQNDMDGRKS